jgi:hypothetical protein
MSDEKKAEETGKQGWVKTNNGWVKTGVAVGIGSAAIVAALLYSSRAKGGKKKD